MATQIQERPRDPRVDDTPRSLLVPGNKDIILTPNDFTSWRSWERLCLGLPLEERDFVDTRNHKRYFFLVNQTSTGVYVIGGPEGHGKSLALYWIAWNMRELFGKRCTFDSAPKETFGYSYEYAQQYMWNEAEYNPPPEKTLGGYRMIDDDSFIEELKKFGEIAKMEKAKEKKDVKEEEFQEALDDVKLFNSVIALDEAYEKLEKARRSNFAVNFGHFLRKFRHYHNLFILVSPDIEDIDKRMVFARRTHEVHCHRDDVTGKCRYRIYVRRQQRWTSNELTPQRWSFLWETHNVLGSVVLPLRKGGSNKE